MAYPRYLRERAIRMRLQEKFSLLEIAERLALPKTTVYYWIAHIPLQRPRRENGHPGNVAMQVKYRRIREEAFERGRDEFGQLATADPSFRDFVSLYIAEGYRRNRNRVSIANSDPTVMIFASSWIRRFTERDLDCSLQYHADQQPDQLRAFWAKALSVRTEQIRLHAQIEQQPTKATHVALSIRGDLRRRK